MSVYEHVRHWRRGRETKDKKSSDHRGGQEASCAIEDTCLCGADDWLPSPVAPSNHHLLSKEDLLCRDLNAKITTGHHNPITGFQNLVKPDREGGREKDFGTCHKDREECSDMLS